jgi:catabolite regulation protein CreA
MDSWLQSLEEVTKLFDESKVKEERVELQFQSCQVLLCMDTTNSHVTHLQHAKGKAKISLSAKNALTGTA